MKHFAATHCSEWERSPGLIQGPCLFHLGCPGLQEAGTGPQGEATLTPGANQAPASECKNSGVRGHQVEGELGVASGVGLVGGVPGGPALLSGPSSEPSLDQAQCWEHTQALQLPKISLSPHPSPTAAPGLGFCRQRPRN